MVYDPGRKCFVGTEAFGEEKIIPIHTVKETQKELWIDDKPIYNVLADGVKAKQEGPLVEVTVTFLARSYVKELGEKL